jgi:hypothetical protein
MPKFDAVASLRIWAVEVELGGRTLRIPPLPAADWLPALMGADVLGLRRLADDIDLDELLLDEGVTVAELTEALELLLESATGRNPWSAFLLAHMAAEHWHVIGADLVRAGLRFESISIAAALDAIYGSACRSMDEKGIARFNAALDRPPAGTVKPEAIRAPRGAKPLPASAEQYVRVRPRSRLRRPQDRQGALTSQPTPPPAPPGHSDPTAGSAPPAPVDVGGPGV